MGEGDKLFAAFAHDLVGHGVAHAEVAVLFAKYGAGDYEDAGFDGGFGKTIAGPGRRGLAQSKGTLGWGEVKGWGKKIDHQITLGAVVCSFG